MINNPHNEGNFSLRLRWYFIIALSIASIYVLIMISGEIYGISVNYHINLAYVNLFYKA
jgi:hypothetical protein